MARSLRPFRVPVVDTALRLVERCGSVTRRAPPLEIHSRQASTRRPAHRSNDRWAVLLLAAIALGGCKTLPQYRFARALPLSRSNQPIDVVSPEGMVGRAER